MNGESLCSTESVMVLVQSMLLPLISKYKYTSLTGFDLLVKSSQETKQSRWGRSWVGSAHLTSWLLSVSFWKFELVRTSRLEFPGITLPEDRFAVTIYSFFHFYHVTFGVFHGESRFLGLRAQARAYSVCACAHFSKKNATRTVHQISVEVDRIF